MTPDGRIAVCPGSYDPVTNGHLDIIERASTVFERVVVGVVNQPLRKSQTLFTAEERRAFLLQATEKLGNVEIEVFDTLLVDFARKRGARALVKGLRAISDFEYEFEMNQLNRKLAPDIESVYLMASPQYSFLSSSGDQGAGDFRGEHRGPGARGRRKGLARSLVKGSAGSKPGQFAIARTSRAARVHDDRRRAVGLVVGPIPASTRSVSACRLASIVSFRSAPACAPAIVLRSSSSPSASRTTSRSPSVPCRTSSWDASSPVSPWLSMPTVPITCERELALRVDPPAVGQHADPGEVELADLRRRRRDRPCARCRRSRTRGRRGSRGSRPGRRRAPSRACARSPRGSLT